MDATPNDPGAGHELALAFDTDDAEFVRGVELGRLWEMAKAFAAGGQPHDDDPPDTFVQAVHATNAEMVLRVAEACQLRVRSEEAAGGWLHVIFERPE